MRGRLMLAVIAALLAAAPALADYDRAPPPPPSRPSMSGNGSDNAGAGLSGRAQAERYFLDGYEDIAKASKETEKGKQGAALKRYRRANERCRQAVQLDTTYFEAWNLVGFTSRKLGDYPASFAAYRVALRLKPDYALAHEYYGEGLLETGDLAGAREQLAALRQNGSPELIAELDSSITRYVAAHPTHAAPEQSEHAATSPADRGGASQPDRAAAAPAADSTGATGGIR